MFLTKLDQTKIFFVHSQKNPQNGRVVCTAFDRLV